MALTKLRPLVEQRRAEYVVSCPGLTRISASPAALQPRYSIAVASKTRLLLVKHTSGRQLVPLGNKPTPAPLESPRLEHA